MPIWPKMLSSTGQAPHIPERWRHTMSHALLTAKSNPQAFPVVLIASRSSSQEYDEDQGCCRYIGPPAHHSPSKHD